jgi:hypothetical protein
MNQVAKEKGKMCELNGQTDNVVIMMIINILEKTSSNELYSDVELEGIHPCL